MSRDPLGLDNCDLKAGPEQRRPEGPTGCHQAGPPSAGREPSGRVHREVSRLGINSR